MVRTTSVIVLAVICAAQLTAPAQQPPSLPEYESATQHLEQEFFSDFNVAASAADADALLQREPGNFAALFVRMETAALQQRTDAVLDAALRLCTMPAPAEIQEISSSRILEAAANSRAFNEVLRRVGLAMEEGNACTFNLRLALVAAAADGASPLDLDKTAASAGLLTRWRIAGAFGRFSNVDFAHQWAPETQQFWRDESSTEPFWFRNGMVSLPDYIAGPGVFYAASNVRIGAASASQVDILSPGPYVLFIDGKRVLAKDSRFVATGTRDSIELHLSAGQHLLVVKFTADAAPFSVDLHRVFGRHARTGSKPLPAPMASYVRELLEYFRGNLTGVERMLASQHNGNHGLTAYINALLWSAAEEHSARARAAWEALKTAQPSALLARIKSAEFELNNGRTDAVRTEVGELEQMRPESEAVAQLSLELARGNNESTVSAFERLINLHPTCSHLTEAIKFYTSIGDQDRSEKAEARLRLCAPESLAYDRLLADSGLHSEAAALLEAKLAHNRLDRNARRMFVEQLVLLGKLDLAREQAGLLHELAPRSRPFAALAEDPSAVLDSHSPRAGGFTAATEFYAKYRRDGLKAAMAAPERTIANGTARLLLMDRVLQFDTDGTASLYSHRVLRLLNKEAISRLGEVSLPRGSDVLELRTIKANGEIIEPEFKAERSTISMPALEPGDSVDEEFVTHFSDWDHLPAAATVFGFGSTLGTVVTSRYTLIVPQSSKVNIELQNGAPPPRVDTEKDRIIRTWSAADIQPVADESFSPDSTLLPAVRITANESTLEHMRDSLIDATRIGPHVIEAAAQGTRLHANESEIARQLYRFVTGRIDSTGSDFAETTAEDSLSSGEGSRTATLLALARASGLNASLLLARKIDNDCTTPYKLRCYTEPLVRFWVAGHVVDTDPDASDLPFGVVSARLDSHSALLVNNSVSDSEPISERLVSVSESPTQERSVGEGDLFLDAEGNLSATIHVRLGAARGQEIRARLRTASERQKQAYFEQLASRIFPGAIGIHGLATHLTDPERQLEFNLQCKVPEFTNQRSGPQEVKQFVPALGLGSVLATIKSRRFPFFIDSVLFESTVFHLHLPAGMSVQSLPHDFVLNSSFGDYAVKFSRQHAQVDIAREFHIPMQLITPGDFPAFEQVAEQIERAERQHLVLESQGEKVTHLQRTREPVGPNLR